MSVDPARLAVVQQCVKQIWAARANGEWAALERALVNVLDPKKKPRERRVRERRQNVILLSDYLDKRRPGERRKPR